MKTSNLLLFIFISLSMILSSSLHHPQIFPNTKNIFLIRHGEKELSDETYDYYMITHRHKNYEWELSERGFEQAEKLAKLFDNLYKSKKEVPLIFVSPFKRTIQTAIPIARCLNTTLRIENGLFEHGHGSWNRSQINEYFKNEKHNFEKYQSRFFITREMSDPPRQKEKAIAWFHDDVAFYLDRKIFDSGRDLIIVTHQEVIFNLAKKFAGFSVSKSIDDFDINCGSIFHYSKYDHQAKFSLKYFLDEH